MSESEEVKGEAQEANAGQPADETAAPGVEELKPLDVYMALRASFHQMAAVAWQMMGLQPDPFTGKIHRDIEQARVAIDCAAFLLEKLLPQLQGQEARDYQSVLTDLRLNFVKQAGR